MKIQKQRKSVVEMARRFKQCTSCLKVLACTRCPWEDVSLKTVRCPRWRIFENRSLILSSKISPSKTGAALNQSVIRSTAAASFTAERRGFYDWGFFFFRSLISLCSARNITAMNPGRFVGVKPVKRESATTATSHMETSGERESRDGMGVGATWGAGVEN